MKVCGMRGCRRGIVQVVPDIEYVYQGKDVSHIDMRIIDPNIGKAQGSKQFLESSPQRPTGLDLLFNKSRFSMQWVYEGVVGTA